MPNSEKEPNDILRNDKNTEVKKSKKLVFLLIVAIVIVVILIIAIWTLSREVNKPVSNITPVDKTMEKLPSQAMDSNKNIANSKGDLHLMPVGNANGSENEASTVDASKAPTSDMESKGMDSNLTQTSTPASASSMNGTPSPVATPNSSNMESKNPLDTKFSSLEDDPKFKALLNREEEKKNHDVEHKNHEGTKHAAMKQKHESEPTPKEISFIPAKPHEKAPLKKEAKPHNVTLKNEKNAKAKDHKVDDPMHRQMYKKIADEKPKTAKPEASKKPQSTTMQASKTKAPLLNGTVASEHGIYLQVGVFSQKPNAKFIEEISKYGYKVKQDTVENKAVTRYLLGPYKSKLDATKDAEKIGQALEIGKPVYYEIK
ncbi:SPOR domain-containing protein [Helicobacter sp. 11S02629-2]|uniref:SPOR domain-containing protein n=1 Tax=Helicobacter sp. 11S02629-2 TaxID=1476195 RepID=UPI000BA52C44|nr:SPOR domain-containing protein [Helicobacter sp. 11S02629-2]PAF45504.1 hypothetical protein BKH40_03320 [Helicobacter sp. 11S02629-2]